MPVIKTENLCFAYDGMGEKHYAVKDMNIAIEKGELVGIIGHTGSGKSTLIRHFNGLLRPTSGKVFIDGEDIWSKSSDMRKIRFKVGMVFQYPEYQLFEETVYNDIAFGPRNMGLPPEEVDRRVHEAARICEVENRLEKSPFDLSGGQKRRVAIAGVMAMEPEILVLDEPAAGLDPKGRDRILGQIKNYQKESGKTVLLVSHSMEDIARLATKVLVINEGRAVKYDTPENVFQNPDELSDMGLCIPAVTEVFRILAEKGVKVDKSVFTPEYAARLLLEMVRGEKQ